jgi:hypothetical protein
MFRSFDHPQVGIHNTEKPSLSLYTQQDANPWNKNLQVSFWTNCRCFCWFRGRNNRENVKKKKRNLSERVHASGWEINSTTEKFVGTTQSHNLSLYTQQDTNPWNKIPEDVIFQDNKFWRLYREEPNTSLDMLRVPETSFYGGGSNFLALTVRASSLSCPANRRFLN